MKFTLRVVLDCFNILFAQIFIILSLFELKSYSELRFEFWLHFSVTFFVSPSIFGKMVINFESASILFDYFCNSYGYKAWVANFSDLMMGGNSLNADFVWRFDEVGCEVRMYISYFRVLWCRWPRPRKFEAFLNSPWMIFFFVNFIRTYTFVKNSIHECASQ